MRDYHLSHNLLLHCFRASKLERCICASPNAHLPDLFESPSFGKQKSQFVPAEASSIKMN